MRRLAQSTPKQVIHWTEWIIKQFVEKLNKWDPKSFNSESAISIQIPIKQLEKQSKQLVIWFMNDVDVNTRGGYSDEHHQIHISFPLETLAHIGIIDMDGHRYSDQIYKLIDLYQTRATIEHELIHAYRSIVHPELSSKSRRLNLGQSRQLKSEFPQVDQDYLDNLLQSKSIPSELQTDNYIVPESKRKTKQDDLDYWKTISEKLQGAFSERYMNSEEELHAWVVNHARRIFDDILKPKLVGIDIKIGESPESVVQRLLENEEIEIDTYITDKKKYRQMVTRIYKYLTHLSLQYLNNHSASQIKIEQLFRSEVNFKANPWIETNRFSEDFLNRLIKMLSQWCREVYSELSSEYDKQVLLKIRKIVYSKLSDRYTKLFS